jgi:DNA-binding transcriptional LysR family regulator
MDSKKDKILEKLPSFDWDKAKNFYYIAKLENMTEAAKQLNITQSSLSRQLTILEETLNCKLCIRTGRGLKLTRKGEELFEIIEESFIKLKGFSYSQAAMTGEGQKRKIRISSTQPIMAYILNDLLLSYQKHHPEIVFEVIADDQLIDLIVNDVDIAIRPHEHDTKGIHQEHLFTLEKKLFASQKYIDMHGKPKSLDELKHHSVVAQIDPEKHPYSEINWILKIGMPPSKIRIPEFTSNFLESLIDAVKEGIGIISCYDEMKIVRNSKLINILPDIKGKAVKWYFTYPHYLEKDEVIKDIKKYLYEEINMLKSTDKKE